MATEKLQTEVRQEQILQAALSLLARDGLEHLSVAALARRVGLVPSALYRHFRDKDQIIDAVLALVRDRLLENVRAVRDETPDALERLGRLLARHLALVRDNRALTRVVFSGELYRGHSARRARMFAGIRAYLDKVAQIAREGQSQGQIRADVDPATVAQLFLGLIQPGAILWHMSGGQFDVTGHAERGWLVIREAIRAR